MISQLDNRALLKLHGRDTQTFLQNQLSNDIDVLVEGVAQLNAYCQHQGKVIALFWVIKKVDDYYLSMPIDLVSIVIQRLTMFKLMSEVEIIDVTNDIIQLGVIDQELEGASTLNERQGVALVNRTDDLDLVDSSAWEKACIEMGVPEVCLATIEKFVPQLLNLDIDEVGVNFSKGCYPGQEVVARLHYLGKSKRRMRQFECQGELKVGDALFVTGSKSAKASGVVVRRVKLGKKSLCLATIEVAYEDDAITLNDATGIQLTRITE